MPRQKQTARMSKRHSVSSDEEEDQVWDDFESTTKSTKNNKKVTKPTAKKQKTVINLTSDSEDEVEEEEIYEEETTKSKKNKKESSKEKGSIQSIISQPNYSKQFTAFAKKIEGTWLVLAGEDNNQYLHEGTLKVSITTKKPNCVSIEFDFNDMYTGTDTGNCHINPTKKLLKWRFLCADAEGEQLPGQGIIFEPKDGIITGFVGLPAYGCPFWGRKKESKITKQQLSEFVDDDDSYTEWKKKADSNDDYSLDQTLSEEEDYEEARVARWH